MSDNKRIDKLLRLIIKGDELEALLKSLGFQKKPGKGSHVKWLKRGLPPIVVATHTKEVKEYQMKQVIKVLKEGRIIE